MANTADLAMQCLDKLGKQTLDLSAAAMTTVCYVLKILSLVNLKGKSLDLNCAGTEELPGGKGVLKNLKRSGITCFNCSYQTNLTDEDYQDLPSSVQELTADHTQATDTHLDNMVMSCPDLKILNLGNTQVTDRGLVKAAKHLLKLESIDLTGCKFVTGIGLTALAEHCKNLTYVTCGDRTTVDGVLALLSSANIKHIDLADASNACDELEKGINNGSVEVPDHIEVVWHFDGCGGCYGCDGCVP